MEEQPEEENIEEEALELEAELSLPYLKEAKQELPKDYDATMERLAAKLEQNEESTTEGKALFGTGLAIGFILMFAQVLELLGYPKWMDSLYHILIFGEACLPFAVSFFLKNPKHATLMRLVGLIVLLVYLFTLFW